MDLMTDMKEKHGTSQTRKRILIVDDYPVVREGLTQFINQENDLEVCAEAGNAKQALEAVEKQHFDLVIVDMLLKNTTGIQLTESLKSKFPDVRVLILSMSNDRYYIKHAFQTGVRGYITKDEVAEEIINAIRQVLDGKIYLSAHLAKKFPRKTLDRIRAGDLEDSVWEYRPDDRCG
jgi:DNA-binding NarL/FixJ family response regulator